MGIGVTPGPSRATAGPGKNIIAGPYYTHSVCLEIERNVGRGVPSPSY